MSANRRDDSRRAANPLNRLPSMPATLAHDQPLIANYHAPAGVFDELLDETRQPRGHYAGLVEHLGSRGLDGLRQRAETGRRLVAEQGITYNVYNDPRGMERPWELDPMPLIMSAAEWSRLESGMVQRATLLNRILADCYGPQELIRTAHLPPALVFGQRDFLRPCHGHRPPDGTWLHLYAADLARSPDGQWWVISDRTQIPTGAGYALANRLISSRILPEPFRSLHVQRLAGFFREMQGALAALGTRRTEHPRVVMLTPGPHNETYFEQAYLARYLGYTLVEGQDLTVRDERVFLKTLSGLDPVDVILRRVDDDFCDPLELRNGSMLGVPGLTGAWRSGNVAVANALGSALLQSPAFMAFLPGLSRHLLGEKLQLPSVATWWCGQQAAAKYVTEHLDSVFVKPAFRTRLRGMDPDRPPSATERTALLARIRFQPHLFVGQELVQHSTAPALRGDALAPVPVALRVYLIATRDGYRMMPGGLARVARESTGRSVAMQRGGASKDVWVLSDQPVSAVTLLASAGGGVELRRVGNNLTSRLADNFYWLGRYGERADATARLLRSALMRFSPESAGSAMPFLAPLLDALEAQGVIESAAEKPSVRQSSEALEAELLAAIFDAERPNSLRSITTNLHRLGMLVRDRTSNDFWRIVSQLHDGLATPSSTLMLAGDAVGVINRLLQGVFAFHGISRENMTRAQAWRFLDMGRRVERALYLCTFLECALESANADDPSALEAVLEFADSTLTYRSRYNLLPDITPVYDLVLLDDTNPRSLLHQLNYLAKHFDRLPDARLHALPTPGQRILLESVARLRLLDPHALGTAVSGWRESDVAHAIRQTAESMRQLSDCIAAQYFAHAGNAPSA